MRADLRLMTEELNSIEKSKSPKVCKGFTIVLNDIGAVSGRPYASAHIHDHV